MKLSIVIPAYNIAEWIGKALDTILNQRACNIDWEVIVVDDGSTDETYDRVVDWKHKAAERDGELSDRLKIIRQANAGVNKARESGWKASSGEYVWFVDGDDVLAPDALAKIAPCLDGDTDLIWVDQVCGASIRFDASDTVPKVDVFSEGLRSVPFFVMHQCIFRRKIVEQVPFDQYLVGEDILFATRSMLLSKKLIHIKAPLYGYVTRESSVMNMRRNYRRASQTIAFTGELLKLYEQEQHRLNPKLVSQRKTQMFYALPSEILKFPREEREKLLSEWKTASGCSSSILFVFRAYVFRMYLVLRRATW